MKAGIAPDQLKFPSILPHRTRPASKLAHRHDRIKRHNRNVMLKRIILLASFLLAAAITPAQTPAAPKSASDAAAQWKQRIAAWRAQRDKELSAPDGWLTLIGLEWLKSGGNSFGSAADNSVPIKTKAPEHFGIITVSGKTIQLLSY